MYLVESENIFILNRGDNPESYSLDDDLSRHGENLENKYAPKAFFSGSFVRLHLPLSNPETDLTHNNHGKPRRQIHSRKEEVGPTIGGKRLLSHPPS